MYTRSGVKRWYVTVGAQTILFHVLVKPSHRSFILVTYGAVDSKFVTT